MYIYVSSEGFLQEGSAYVVSGESVYPTYIYVSKICELEESIIIQSVIADQCIKITVRSIVLKVYSGGFSIRS